MFWLPPPLDHLFAGAVFMGLSVCAGYGACHFGDQAVEIYRQGVRTQAVVANIDDDPLSPYDPREHYVLEADGQTMYYDSPQEYNVGDKLNITYFPGTTGIELTADRPSPWKVLPVCGVVIVFAASMFCLSAWGMISGILEVFPDQKDDSSAASPKQSTTK